jgi:6-pyruvoyl-tetrahydropterin synthase
VVSRERLDGHGMVVDLALLEAELKTVRAELDGRDLEAIRPPDSEAVTVEVFARWLWDRLAPLVVAAGADELSVRVNESADAFGGYRARVG